MKYKIIKIKSKTKLRQTILYLAVIVIFFACILSSIALQDWTVPEFLLETHMRMGDVFELTHTVCADTNVLFSPAFEKATENDHLVCATAR